jgi:hypothetical protein
MNRLALGSPIQAALQFWKEFRSLFLLTGGDQCQELLLGTPSRVQKTAVHLTTAEGGTGLFGGRSSIGHKQKQCPKRGVDVNP